MGYRGAKRFKGYSPGGGGLQTSPISSSLDKRRVQKPHVGIPRASFNHSNSPKLKTPHHNHLPLRQKTKRTVPVIEPFVPWTPESSPLPEKHHIPDEECVATPTKKRKLESSGMNFDMFSIFAEFLTDTWGKHPFWGVRVELLVHFPEPNVGCKAARMKI
jgi:hypothetical protein